MLIYSCMYVDMIFFFTLDDDNGVTFFVVAVEIIGIPRFAFTYATYANTTRTHTQLYHRENTRAIGKKTTFINNL